jgi:hypothetical protein
LDDAVGFASGELGKSVEDGSRAEGETDEGDGADADVAVDEGIGEDEAGGFGSVEGVGPWAGGRKGVESD